jgi:peptide/nickel transport system permease protein
VIYVTNLFQGDLGTSTIYHIKVSELISTRMLTTVCLALTATVFTVIIGLPLGYIAGAHKDKLPDVVIRLFALVGLSAPSFWVGLVLLIIFGVNLSLFPVSGWGKTWPEHLYSLVLPGLTLAFASIAVIIRNVRNNVVDVRNTDYVDFGRSKGLSGWVISTGYVLRNALIPTATLLSMRIIGMLSGSVIIENIFGLPGIGALLVQAVTGRDYATVQACVMVFVVITLVVNLLTDILYSVLDHRIKLGGDEA